MLARTTGPGFDDELAVLFPTKAGLTEVELVFTPAANTKGPAVPADPVGAGDPAEIGGEPTGPPVPAGTGTLLPAKTMGATPPGSEVAEEEEDDETFIVKFAHVMIVMFA